MEKHFVPYNIAVELNNLFGYVESVVGYSKENEVPRTWETEIPAPTWTQALELFQPNYQWIIVNQGEFFIYTIYQNDEELILDSEIFDTDITSVFSALITDLINLSKNEMD